MEVKIEQEWKTLLQREFDTPYFEALAQFVKEEYARHTIFPSAKLIFNAFDQCSVRKSISSSCCGALTPDAKRR